MNGSRVIDFQRGRRTSWLHRDFENTLPMPVIVTAPDWADEEEGEGGRWTLRDVWTLTWLASTTWLVLFVFVVGLVNIGKWIAERLA